MRRFIPLFLMTFISVKMFSAPAIGVHPRLFFGPAKLAQLRTEILANTDQSSAQYQLYENIKSQADWLSPTDRYLPNGTWPINKAGYYMDIPSLAFRYLISGEEQWAQRAAVLIFNPPQTDQIGAIRFQRQGIIYDDWVAEYGLSSSQTIEWVRRSNAQQVICLSIIYDWLHDYLQPSQLLQIQQKITSLRDLTYEWPIGTGYFEGIHQMFHREDTYRLRIEHNGLALFLAANTMLGENEELYPMVRAEHDINDVLDYKFRSPNSLINREYSDADGAEFDGVYYAGFKLPLQVSLIEAWNQYDGHDHWHEDANIRERYSKLAGWLATEVLPVPIANRTQTNMFNIVGDVYPFLSGSTGMLLVFATLYPDNAGVNRWVFDNTVQRITRSSSDPTLVSMFPDPTSENWEAEHNANSMDFILPILSGYQNTPSTVPSLNLNPTNYFIRKGEINCRSLSNWGNGNENEDVAFTLSCDNVRSPLTGTYEQKHTVRKNHFTLAAYGDVYLTGYQYGELGQKPENNNVVLIQQADGTFKGEAYNGFNAGPATSGQITEFTTTSRFDYFVGDATDAYNALYWGVGQEPTRFDVQHYEQGVAMADPSRLVPGASVPQGAFNTVDHARRHVTFAHAADGIPAYVIVSDDIQKDANPHRFKWQATYRQDLFSRTSPGVDGSFRLVNPLNGNYLDIFSTANSQLTVTESDVAPVSDAGFPVSTSSANYKIIQQTTDATAINPFFHVALVPHTGNLFTPNFLSSKIMSNGTPVGEILRMAWERPDHNFSPIKDYDILNYVSGEIASTPTDPLPHFTVDARVAHVRMQENDVISFVMGSGRSLICGDRVLADLDAVGSVVVDGNTVKIIGPENIHFRIYAPGATVVQLNGISVPFAQDPAASGYITRGVTNLSISANVFGSAMQSLNAQNKILETVNSELYLAFESQGTAYFTLSTDQGQTWAIAPKPMEEVSSQTTTFRSPTIGPDPGFSSSAVDLLWERVDMVNGTRDHKIQWRKADDGWEPVTISGFTTTSDVLANPVMAVFGNEVMAAWKSDRSIELAHSDYTQTGNPWIQNTDPLGTGTNSANPCLATEPGLPETQNSIVLVWEDEWLTQGNPGGIQARVLNKASGNGWQPAVTIAANAPDGIVINKKPTAIFDDASYLHILWEQFDAGTNTHTIKWNRYTPGLQEVLEGPDVLSWKGAESADHHAISVCRRQGGLLATWIVDGVGLIRVGYSSSGAWGVPVLANQFVDGRIALTDGALAVLPLVSAAQHTLAFQQLPTAVSNTEAGWNLVSLPVANSVAATVAFSSANSFAYKYDGGYVASPTLDPGTGYWLKFPGDATHNFYQSYLSFVQIPVKQKWNIVGSLTDGIPASKINFANLDSKFYGYTVAHGYSSADYLEAGKGYWIKAKADGNITLTYGSTLTYTHPQYATPVPCSIEGVTVPVAPAPYWPLNYSAGLTSTIKFLWSPGVCIGFYHFQLSTDSAFHTLIADRKRLDAESTEVSNLTRGTKYFWRVNDSIPPLVSSWSQIFTVNVGPPQPPALLYPADQAVMQPLREFVEWTPVLAAVKYRVQVSTSSSFTALVADDSLPVAPGDTIGSLAIGTMYYWRVAASNGEWWSNWSPTWSFTTGAPPSAPGLMSPSDGATAQLATIIMRWSRPASADTFRLQVSPVSYFSFNTVDDSMIVDTSREVSGLVNYTSYYWRVQARNSFGTGAWSAARIFTVGPPPPAPTLIAPATASTGVSVTPTLSWAAVSGPTHYEVQLSKQGSFDTIACSYSPVNATSMQTGYLEGATRYYWRVRAVNVVGTSPWSDEWYFTTGAAPPPAVPVLNQPLNNASQLNPVDLTVSWYAATNATSYRVQLSVNSSCIPPLWNAQTSDLSYTDGDPLQFSTTYYWRVQAVNAAGASAWSAVRQFTTLANSGSCGGSLAMVNSTSTMDAITISDAGGYGQTLYLYNGMDSLTEELGRNNEMPPEPAQGIFSARFETGHFYESLHPNKGRRHLPAIRIKNAQYPLTISWVLREKNKMQYWMPHPDNPHQEILLEHQGRVSLSGNGNKTLLLDAQASSICPPSGGAKTVARLPQTETEGRPKEFALRQNAPNPFNPTTAINYEIPTDALVELKVYNMLGQEVATLVNAMENAGYHSTTFNASSVASGVYFYRFKATPLSNGEQGKDFVRIMKMVLLK